ncbi:MAG: ABC transporter ATP-binding protein [Silicimonas sp.]|jgi:capsular polysaccharide transport system ATP-binding protein|nr:ABC transporter ATP-binding protein [Silicimonas sp.]
MIRLLDVSKRFHTGGVEQVVADRVSLTFPGGLSVALLGRNGAGKSSLLKMIAGTLRPTSGRIEVSGSVSWPVGFAGSFHADLTGVQNVRFVARIYGVDSDALEVFVREFSGLGDHLALPVRTYSQGMRARLGFGLSMGIGFDTYLIDEITAVGDAAFREKCEAALAERLAHRGAVIVSHSLGFLTRVCDAGVVIENGRAVWFDDIRAAVEAHRSAMAQPA